MRRPWMVFAVLALTAAACSDDGSDGSTTDPPVTPDTTSTPIAPAPAVTDPPPSDPPEPDPPPEDDPPAPLTATVRPGVEQVAVIGASPGNDVVLVADDGAELASGTVDDLGSWLVRELEGGTLARVHDITDDLIGDPVQVIERGATPAPSFYAEQRLPTPGYGYLETRDGTTLSVNVVLPGAPEDGPYPTVVEYSGYTPSDPDAGGFKDLFPALGYAYVGVNMRGTGCSGGSFRFFEYTQSTDGYDAIETIAAQPWVLDNRVGTVGISYPGISQLFVAQTQPPSLTAISPFSVIDDSYNGTLYPGGILNTGFAVDWTQQRVDEAQPAPDGQEWAANRIAAGDETCEANQSLRLQNPDLVEEIVENDFYEPAIADELAPRLFVDQIEVPTFIAGAWQDEQTGGRFPTMISEFTGTDHLYVSLVNGLHTESISPMIFARLVEFLDLYVAERTPSLAAASVVAPILAGGIFGTTEVGVELGVFDDRFAGMTHEDALAAFEAEPPVQVMFEQGAAEGVEPLAPLPRFVRDFDSWPIPADVEEWYLGSTGSLLDAPEVTSSTVDYLALPDGIPETFHADGGSDTWRTDVEWNWQDPAPGTAATFLSQPLVGDLPMIGSASADLWITSNLGDTDLEVTLSEVRPDGNEVYVQSGWLRASHRSLDESASTRERPVHTHAEADARPLDPETLELVRVEVFPFAHVFRAGSQIRVSIDAPGGNRARWEFETIANGEQVTIGIGGDTPSRIVLPTLRTLEVPAEYPACDSLRGQPCRPFAS